MRSIIGAPRRKFSDLAEVAYNGVLHLKFEDAAGTTITDTYANSSLTASTTTIITAPYYEQTAAALGKGRDFTVAGSSTGNAVATAGQRTFINGNEWTIEWVGQIDSLAGDLVTLFGHGTSSVTANAIFNVGVAMLGRSDGRIQLYFEGGTRAGTTMHSDVGAIVAGQLLHIAVRKQKNSITSDYFYDFFVNGKWCGRATTSNNSAAGSSSNWRLGTALTPTSTGFSGEIYEIRMVGVALSSAFIRNDAHLLLKRFDYEAMFDSMTYSAHARVLLENSKDGTCSLIDDDTNMVDLDAYEKTDSAQFALRHHVLDNVKVKDDADSTGASASFTCAREVYDWRYSPFFSKASAISNSGQRLFDLARRVMVEVAIVPQGVERDEVEGHEWIRLFDGHISSVDFGDQTMEVQCRDRMAPLQWTFIRPIAPGNAEPIYGDDSSGVAIETVLQQIISAATPSGGMIGGAPTLFTPVSPGWALRKRSVSFQPLADALTEKTDQLGWQCRYLWDSANFKHRLTLIEPDRSISVPMRTWDRDRYLNMRSAALNEDTIRNVCEVIYTNRLALVNATFTANTTTEIVTHTSLDVPTLSKVNVSSSGTLPAPLAAGTDYWTVRQSSSSSKLATSLANAQANTTIDLTTTGTGTHTLTVVGASGSLADWPRARVIASDSTSIAAYGERYCQITEEAASQIDTSIEAANLADAVVADLATPKAICAADHLCFPFVDLGDYYAYDTEDHFQSDEQFAVTSYEHSFDASGNHMTSVGLRNNPVAHVDTWIENTASPGVGPHAPGLAVLVPVNVITTPFDGGIHVKFPFPVNNLTKNFDLTEVHMTTDVGAWTPSAATLRGVTRADSLWVPLEYGPNVDVQTKIVLRDKARNITAAVAGTTRKSRASLNDSPVGEVRRDDGAGTYGPLANNQPLYFPNAFHNPYSAFVQGSGPGGTMFVAPWTGKYTFHVAARFARNPSAPARSNTYRVYAVVSPTSGTSGTGSGGTLIAQNANSGWVLPGLAASLIDLEITNWSFSLHLTASSVVALQIVYGLDPSVYSRCYFDMPEAPSTAGQQSSWKAYFNGAGV